MRAVAATAVALGGSSLAVPAYAEASAPDPAASSPAAPDISDAGLAEAVQRDLGMTMEEFNAAGTQAKRAAAAATTLRALPGYLGIVLRDGKIVVQGHGTELQAGVNELNKTAPADIVLEAPAGSAAATPAPSPSASPAPKATPKAAPGAAPELRAGSAEQLFQAYVRDVGPAGLQAVAYADGHFIIRTGGTNSAEASTAGALVPGIVRPFQVPAPGTADPAAQPAPGKTSAADFVARYANVELEKGAAIKTEEDYFGGQGFVIDNMTICSAGFGAFDPHGLPLVLTAGHCAEDGAAARADVEPSTAAPAGGATTALPAVPGLLGTFGFSQFGGPNNSAITGTEATPGNIGTDIAVIKDVRPGLDVQSSATTWQNPAAPARTSVKIIGTTAPYQGQAVCRSGRTTGWSCGTVAETGIYVVAGRTTDPADLRAFKGFLSHDVQSSGGDSGGPWISGNYAVGTHSAGEPKDATQNFAVATTLQDALGYVPGPVQLRLFLNKPTLAGTADGGTVLPGSVIRGHVAAAPASAVAADSKVRLTRQDQAAVDLPVDAAGNWSFSAPAAEGPFQFTAETVNGFSKSGAKDFRLNVSALPAPAITTPAPGSTSTGLDSVEGTGTPGSVVTLSGDLAGSATVAPDGQWSIPLGNQPVYGKVTVSAVQASAGHADSPTTTAEFSVRPPAPVVDGDWAGASFRQGEVPAAISGTGVDAASVTVLIDGQAVGQARAGAAGMGTKGVSASLVPQVVVAGGRWSVAVPDGLAVGPHTVSVSQSVDGVASAPMGFRFRIDQPAAAAASGGPAASAGPAAAAGPAAPAPGAAALGAGRPVQQPGGPAALASTGAGGALTAAGWGAGALLLGGALLAASRRRAVR